MATTRKVIALEDNGLQELVDEVVVGIPGTGASSEVHNSEVPSNASGVSAFSANEGFAEGALSFAANSSQSPGLRSFSANGGVSPGAGSFAANGGLANGDGSLAAGSGTIAHSWQFVCGMYNKDNGEDDVGEPAAGGDLFKVGIGTTSDAPDRLDGFAVNRDGIAKAGGFAFLRPTNITDDYTVLPTDGYIRATADAGGLTVLLPAPTGSGRIVCIKRSAESTGDVIVDSASGTVEGAATVTISASISTKSVLFVDGASGKWDYN